MKLDEHALNVVEYIDACIQACGESEPATDRDFCRLAAGIVDHYPAELDAYCKHKWANK